MSDDFTTGTGFEDEIFSFISKLENDEGGAGVNPLNQAPFGAVQPEQQSYHHEQTYHHNLPAAANHQMVHRQPSTCNQCCIELPLYFKYTLDKDGRQAKILSDMLETAR